MEFDFVTNFNTIIVPAAISLSTAVLIIHSNRKDKKKEIKDTEFLKLIEERERLKEEAVMAWREFYTKGLRDNKDVMCGIKKDVGDIRESLHDKVDWGHCNDIMQKHDDRLRSVHG